MYDFLRLNVFTRSNFLLLWQYLTLKHTVDLTAEEKRLQNLDDPDVDCKNNTISSKFWISTSKYVNGEFV